MANRYADPGKYSPKIPAGTEYVQLNDASSDAIATVDNIRRAGVTALSISSGVVNIDLSLGDYFTLALSANVTSITFTNQAGSGRARTISIRLRQDATGSRTVALPSSFKAVAGSDTSVQASANAYTLLIATSFDQGARWEYAMRGVAA